MLPALQHRRPRAIEVAHRHLLEGLVPESRDVDPAYQTDPIRWMVEKMGVAEHTLRWAMNPGYDKHKWDGTPDPLVAMADAVGRGEWVVCESATSIGKTFWLALLTMWWMDVFPGGEVVTVAPKRDQLSLHLWKELGKMFPRYKRLNPVAKLTALKLRMTPPSNDWAAVGFVAGVGSAEDVASKARGFHAPNLLFIVEETPGVNPATLKAIRQTLTGGKRNQLVAVGNPEHQQDPLHLMVGMSRVTPIRISALDHPNVVADREDLIPGAVTAQSITDRIADAADGEDDPIILANVRGICPNERQRGLIKMQWIREAQARYQEIGEELRGLGPKAYGVDVADSKNGDYASWARGEGAVCDGVTSFGCPDANLLGMEVVVQARAEGVRAVNIGVDGIGVGAGTVNEARRMGMEVQNLKGSHGMVPDDGVEVFLNWRAQSWWQLRRDLKNGEIAFAFDDPELFRELLVVQFEIQNGKIKLKPKAEIKKDLGGRSPDKADALVNWNWARMTRTMGPLIGRA